jgi:hypothetical protein
MDPDVTSKPIAAPKPKRRWWQFTVSALLIATAIVAAWLGIVRLRAERQRTAVAAIEATGGSVKYAADLSGNSPTGLEKLVRHWLPRDYFDDVDSATLVRQLRMTTWPP